MLKAPVLKARVLAVDCDEKFLRTLGASLERSFSEVDRAPSEKVALEFLAGNRYDLVLMDVLFGEEPSGLALCRRIKGEESLKGMPVLIVSDVDRRWEMGLKSLVGGDSLPADDFVDKSSGTAEIVERARRLIERPATSET